MSNYKNAVCKGCWQFGNNCGKCERCIETEPVNDTKIKQRSDTKEMIIISVERELFRFTSEQDWVNNAQRYFAQIKNEVSKDFYICVDKQQNVCKMGKHFREATENNSYPVVCYEIRR